LHVLGNARGEKRRGKRLIVLHSHHFDAVQQALSSFYTKTTWQRRQASQSSNQVLLRMLSTALKFPMREPDHPLPSRAKVKDNEKFSIRLLVLQRQIFTLRFVCNWNKCFYTVQVLRSFCERRHFFLLTKMKCASAFGAQATYVLI